MNLVITMGSIERIGELKKAKSGNNFVNVSVWTRDIGIQKYNENNVKNQTLSGDATKKKMLEYISNENYKTYWVIKKNTQRLREINEIFSIYKNLYEKYHLEKSEYPVVKKMKSKFLIIDDEADLASQDGSKRNDDQVTKTNQLIIDLINKFKKVSFVSYTATPFANLLTDRNKTHDDSNLFPDDFISLISAGSSYTGFSRYDNMQSEINNVVHANKDFFKELIKDSVLSDASRSKFEESILIFLLFATLLKIRETKNGSEKIEKIKSMMINFNHRTVNQGKILKYFDSVLTGLLTKFITNKAEFFIKLEKIIADRYKYLHKIYKTSGRDSFEKYFSEIIKKCVADVVNLGNTWHDLLSRAKDSEDAIVIIIGGYKLPRGLTIPGLLTTIFYRNTNNFDSAMQMCRWFGYREHYLDLTNLFTTDETWKNYEEIFGSYEEFKQEILNQTADGLTAEEFLIKIRLSYNLLPTQKNKEGCGETNW